MLLRFIDEERGQMLENVDQTHVVLASDKLECCKKLYLVEWIQNWSEPDKLTLFYWKTKLVGFRDILALFKHWHVA